MRELTFEEVDLVNGAGRAGGIAMGLAAGWAGAVAGVGVGLVVGGPIGGIAGGLVDFGIGAGGTIGYALTQDDDVKTRAN
ncbi:MAG TPA: hypothetical protein VIT90_05115 [Lysobacter sp.]